MALLSLVSIGGQARSSVHYRKSASLITRFDEIATEKSAANPRKVIGTSPPSPQSFLDDRNFVLHFPFSFFFSFFFSATDERPSDIFPEGKRRSTTRRARSERTPGSGVRTQDAANVPVGIAWRVLCARHMYVRYVQHVPMNLSTPVSLSRCRVFFFASAALIISESTGACGWRNYVTDTSTRRLEGHGNVIISLGIKGWNLVREKTSHRSRKRLIRLFQFDGRK